ncbi:caspase family protein, partial [Enterobacter roggenkampii]|nr:caspase family protein [Enterobacter roggenkampii]
MSKPIESKMTKLSNFVDVIAGLESSNLNQILGQTQQISKKTIADEPLSEKVNIAIIIGISDYGSTESNLPQCKNDMELTSEIVSRIKKPLHTLKLSGKASGREASDKLINFFKEIKEKSLNVDELFFYFTGHGLSHDTGGAGSESRLVFSDYSQNRINETTISSDFIDDLARDISPVTYVKIIDACFSGSKLIKNAIDQRDKFLEVVSKDKKHYENSGFNNVYVMASSRNDQLSFANTKYSDFSESIFQALFELEGEIKYRHLVNRLADDFSKKEQRPVFVMQGSFDEGFGEIDADTKQFIYGNLISEYASGIEIKNSDKTSENDDAFLKDLEAKLKEKTKENIFNSESLKKYIASIDTNIESLSKKISAFYTYSVNASEKKPLPNEVVIGEWLKNNKHTYFATPRYRRSVTNPLASNSSQSVTNPTIPPTQNNNNEDLQPLIGFLFQTMTDNDTESRIRQVTFTPKDDFRILDSISI